MKEDHHDHKQRASRPDSQDLESGLWHHDPSMRLDQEQERSRPEKSRHVASQLSTNSKKGTSPKNSRLENSESTSQTIQNPLAATLSLPTSALSKVTRKQLTEETTETDRDPEKNWDARSRPLTISEPHKKPSLLERLTETTKRPFTLEENEHENRKLKMTRMRTMSPRGRRLTTVPSHGKSKKRTPLRERRASVSGEPERFWKTSQRTQRESNPHSLTLIPALSSQMPNGPMSLQDGQSTWITSLADSTQYSKTRNKSRKWETSRSQSGHLPQLDKSDPTETGPSLGTKPSGPSHMSSLTEKTSSETTGSISQNSSLLYRLGLTKELYSLTKPSELELGCDGMSTYLTEKVTTTLSPFGSKQVELTRDHRMAADQVTPNNDDEKAVDDGTKAVVPTHRPIATTPIPAVNAEVADTPPKTVLDHRKSNLFEKWTSRPRSE